MNEVDLFFQLFFLLIALAVVGEPFRLLIARFTEMFRKQSILRLLIIDFYLGGMFLYFIALLPFGLFQMPILYIVTLSALILSLAVHKSRFSFLIKNRQFTSIKVYVKLHLRNVIETIAVSLLALIIYWVAAAPMTVFVLGSVHDTSQHALFTQVLLQHSNLEPTLAPYLSAPLTVPQGHTVIFAYACLLLGWNAAQSVFYLTPLFIALTAFGAYYLGEEIAPQKYLGLMFAFIIAIVSTYPLFVTWGGNSFLAGLPFFFVCCGVLIFQFRHMDSKQWIIGAAICGLLIGYLAAIHETFYFVLLFAAFIAAILAEPHSLKKIRLRLSIFLWVLLISLLPISVYLYRLSTVFLTPIHNVGIPNPITSNFSLYPGLVPVYHSTSSLTAFDISAYPFLRYLWISLAIATPIIALLIIVRQKRSFPKQFEDFLLFIFISAFLLWLLTEAAQYLPSQTASSILELLYPRHLNTIMEICVSLFIGACSLYIFSAVYDALKNNWFKIKRGTFRCQRKGSKGKIMGLFLLLGVIVALFTPFIYYRASSDSSELVGLYSMFTPTQDDYALMTWMKDNISANAVILVNPYEAGNFIPSISQKVAIYPTSDYQLSYPYYQLCTLIQEEILNSTTYQLMQFFNITYVYVGAKADYWWIGSYKWDPSGTLFLGNPNFQLVKKIGIASLYAFNLTSPNVSFKENFQESDIRQNGWQLITDQTVGKGEAEFLQSSEEVYGGNYSFEIIAQKTQGSAFAAQIQRSIQVPDSSNVFLSFHLAETGGVIANGDSFTVVISSPDWKNEIYFALPGTTGVSPIIPISSNSGYYNLNLSQEWSQLYNTALPKTFYLEILNRDVDGVPNVGYISDITVESGS